MTNSIYITTTERYSGKSLVSLGIMELLLRRSPSIGVFRPVIEEPRDHQRDKNIDLLLTYFNLDIDYEDTFAYYRKEVADLLAEGRTDELINKVIAKYKNLERQCDFVLCIGSDFEEGGSAMETSYNAEIARHLGSPVLIVTSAVGQTVETVINEVKIVHDVFEEAGCQILGTIVNRTDIEIMYDLIEALEEEMPDTHSLLSVIPARDMLSSPTLKEVSDYMGARVLYGADQLDLLAYDYLIIAMKIPNYLPHLTNNALLITSGDRCEIILSALQAHQSRNYPKISGILLTGGLQPPPAVDRLLSGLDDILPILSVPENTYQTAMKIGQVPSYITGESEAKIKLSLRLFERHVNTAALEDQLAKLPDQGITPKMFIYNLIQKAKEDKRHIVLPEGTDERILTAAAHLVRNNIVEITLLGDPKEVQTAIYNLGLRRQLQNVPIINPLSSPKIPEYAETLMELRKHKGMNMDMATDQLTDVSYFGTMMVYRGDADGMVSGAAHTTQHTIRPALQFVKTKPGFTVVSSVFFMALPDRVLVYGDCAVNPNPTAEQLAEIAIASADTALAFGIKPRIAMLSYSSGESGIGEDVVRVREATKIAQDRRPDLILEGPMQYDAAVSPEVAAKKMPGSQVAGLATVFIFPDLNTGNNTYKAVQRETGAIAIGPVLQGLNKPVNDLSRGCTVEDVINTVAITAIQAQLD
ncbi:MAG: phosphate acetyltransferase [Candidatus Promineifilaceae bacterium]|nr:phosphate acetyltransferase [Candidatus Promineifilaceae bacterium]